MPSRAARPVFVYTSSTALRKTRVARTKGRMTLERSKTVDEEISDKVIDFLDRNDPKKTGKPFCLALLISKTSSIR